MYLSKLSCVRVVQAGSAEVAAKSVAKSVGKSVAKSAMLIALIALITASAPSVAQAAPTAAAASEKETELNARQAFAAARYDEAIELFARLYAETLNPIYLRNIGRCHQKKREPEKAIDAFQDYLAKGRSISSSERKEIQGYVKEMEQLRDEQAKEREAQSRPPFAAAPAAPVTVAPLATTPTAPNGAPEATGVTTVNLSPAPNAGWSSTASPAAASTGGAALVSGPQGDQSSAAGADHPVYTRWWFWTAIGVVVAGGVVAALLLPGGVSKPACFSSTPGACQ
jgi:hypothetical protein